jgi:hypothetical protein
MVCGLYEGLQTKLGMNFDGIEVIANIQTYYLHIIW